MRKRIVVVQGVQAIHAHDWRAVRVAVYVVRGGGGRWEELLPRDVFHEHFLFGRLRVHVQSDE